MPVLLAKVIRVFLCPKSRKKRHHYTQFAHVNFRSSLNCWFSDNKRVILQYLKYSNIMFYNVACCYIYFCFYLDTKDFTIIKNNNKVKHNITLKGYKFAQLFAQLFAHVRTDMYICKRNI